MSNYVKGLFGGVHSLLTGMKVTLREFFTPKVTEQYPENRATLKMFDRYCGELTMPRDAEGHNKCIACGLCQNNCPNGTIRITTETVTDPRRASRASGSCATNTTSARACSATCVSTSVRRGRSASPRRSSMPSIRVKNSSKH